MDIKVLDASAFGAVLFGEPDAAKVAEQLHSARLVAPSLLYFELASICLKKLKRHPDKRDQILSAYHLRNQIGVAELEIDFDDVIVLAETRGLTVYDASYLHLAHKLDAGLITLDKQLAQAANL